MKRKIVILTEGFPYWAGENFLSSELSCLSAEFDIYLLPLLLPKNAQLQPLPENVNVLKPILYRNYLLRFLQGLFNLSPILPFILDFKEIFRDKKGNIKSNFLRWATTMVNSRALLASSQINNLQNEQNTAIYLYWCNYPVKFFSNFPNRIFSRVHGTEFAKIKSDYVPMSSYRLSDSENTFYIPISTQAAQLITSIANVQFEINRLGVFRNNLQDHLTEEKYIRIVSVAYLIPKKRVHLIIEALKLISNINIEWIHFGDGPLWVDLNKKSKLLGTNINVKLKGFVSNIEVLEFYRQNYVDLFINVSEIEGVPVSIMEAMSFGIPVFATDVGGTQEIVNNQNGLIVPGDFDLKELANFISKIKYLSSANKFRFHSINMWEERSNAQKNYGELVNILNS